MGKGVFKLFTKLRCFHHSHVIERSVHGSLARAGKVKSQTPKVEKQEKKKNPRGRAKKRMLYNRRFVVVTRASLVVTK
jgi:small subunit ribosomal protein S30e